jgi:hypothetical protein
MRFPDLKETYFLESLWWGLEYLARENRKIEDHVRGSLQNNLAGDVAAVAFSQFGSEPDDTVVLNYFVWYSNSLITFLKLFKKAYPLAEDWKPFFPGVLKWRHKVAAHTAYTDPRGDNACSQEMSIMMTPNWENDSFIVGRVKIVGAARSSHDDWAWSLTEVHRTLVAFLERNQN